MALCAERSDGMEVIMKKFLSNYKSTIILLVAIIVGAIVGIIFQEKATILKPLRRHFSKSSISNYCTPHFFNNYNINLQNEAT